MLIITRREGESLMVDGPAKITILPGGRGKQTRIGVEADKEVLVLREELYLAQKKPATTVTGE